VAKGVGAMRRQMTVRVASDRAATDFRDREPAVRQEIQSARADPVARVARAARADPE